MTNNATITCFLDNRKVLWSAGGAGGECRCVAAQRSLHEVRSGLNLFNHSNKHLDDGSSSLPRICKTIPSDRCSIPSTGKRPHNVQITAKANCDRRPCIGNREMRARRSNSGGRAGEGAAHAACMSSRWHGHVVASSRSIPQRRCNRHYARTRKQAAARMTSVCRR